MVSLSDERSFVVADLPGLIEGAHEGHGLGHQFLRHVERTKVLIHLVDVSGASGRDPVDDFDAIRRELELYNPALLEKPQLVAANKMDALDDPARVAALEKRVKKLKLRFFKISAVTGAGVAELVEAAWPYVEQALAADAAAARPSEDDDGEAPADYHPALVPPLRGGRRNGRESRRRDWGHVRPHPLRARGGGADSRKRGSCWTASS